jgi:hypothetical protein
MAHPSLRAPHKNPLVVLAVFTALAGGSRSALVVGAHALGPTPGDARPASIGPPQQAAAAAGEDAPAKSDPLAEPRRIVEVETNTITNLQRAIALYETALKDESLPARDRSNGWADVSRAYQRLGDLEASRAAKLLAYEKGQAAGKKGEALDHKNVDAIFWATANMACVGRTKGVMNSLFMVGDLKKDLNRVLALDPNYHFARDTLGEIDHAVPGLAGGSDARAEEAYTEVLRRDPHFTAAMVRLAILKRDRGETQQARAWAQRVFDEKSPTRPHDWRKFDVLDARAVMNSLP